MILPRRKHDQLTCRQLNAIFADPEDCRAAHHHVQLWLRVKMPRTSTTHERGVLPNKRARPVREKRLVQVGGSRGHRSVQRIRGKGGDEQETLFLELYEVEGIHLFRSLALLKCVPWPIAEAKKD